MKYLWIILGVAAVSAFWMWRICRAARVVCGTCVAYRRTDAVVGGHCTKNKDPFAYPETIGCPEWRARTPQVCSCDCCAEAQAKGEGRK